MNEGSRYTYKQVAGVVGVAIMGFTVQVGTHKCFSLSLGLGVEINFDATQ